MIKPTIGRVVWYYEVNSKEPQAAIVVCVNADNNVNLVIFHAIGFSSGRVSVFLRQEHDSIPEGEPYCEWMPYQLGQAAKTEAVEAKIKEQSNG